MACLGLDRARASTDAGRGAGRATRRFRTHQRPGGRELLVSPKTVEAQFARAYRKLGIHSRAELGALRRLLVSDD